MVIKPRGMVFTSPDIFLGGVAIRYVDQFKYLGHIISNDLTDDADIEREIRNMYIRGNTIVRRFKFLGPEIKCSLFKSYCYCMYTSSLWSNYRQSTLNKLKVCYNDIMRKLMGVPRWHSARTLFVRNNTRSFFENIRYTAYNLLSRIRGCNNTIIRNILQSDCFVASSVRRKWQQYLVVRENELFLY